MDAVAFMHRSVACYRAGIAEFESQESYVFPRAILCIVVNTAQPSWGSGYQKSVFGEFMRDSEAEHQTRSFLYLWDSEIPIKFLVLSFVGWE